MTLARALPDLTTADAYVAWMEVQEHKFETIAGRLVMMAGGSNAHATIALNVAILLRAQLRGGACRPFTSDYLVEVDAANRFYPDVTVACAETRNYTDRPVLVVEVLSESTQQFDMSLKLQAYQRLSGLNDILFLWQDRPRARLHSLGKPPLDIIGLDSTVELPLLHVSLPMSAIYEDVPLAS